jgi:hypothetical protein
MIRHAVFIRFRPEIARAERDALYASLAGLSGQLAGMGRLSAGPNVSPEGLGKGFDEGFAVDFTDAAARDAYLADPRHRAIGARIVAAAAGGPDGIFVFDLEI